MRRTVLRDNFSLTSIFENFSEFPKLFLFRSKYGTLARKITLLRPINLIIFLVTFNFICISHFFSFLYLISECDFMLFRSDFNHVSTSVFAKIYLERMCNSLYGNFKRNDELKEKFYLPRLS